ncbi:MAG TPA: GNAT family N-acetyltransferase [bacterium]|nr:GNAT family N-acetyltransferase [bacterium]
MSALRARAATASEIDERNRLTAPVWGNRLTVEQYLERERRLRETAFSKSAMRTWVLERDDGRVVASHESYRMVTDGDFGPGHAEGIASVFVEEPLRGQGFAKEILAQSLARFREEKAQASILWSEVGAGIYAKLGYHDRPIRARQWLPAAGPIGEVATPFARNDADAPDPGNSVPAGAGAPSFRIVLTREQLEWHRERAAFYHQVLAPSRRHPDSLAGATAGEAWIHWMPDYRLERLMVLACRTGTHEENLRLAEALRRATWTLGMPVAELWISPSLDLWGGTTVNRDDELPMIAPIADGIAPMDWSDYGRGCWI